MRDLRAILFKAAIVSSVLALWLVVPTPVWSQPSFGTCDDWLTNKVNVSDSPTERDLAKLSPLEMGKFSYRIGFSNGFLFGLFGNLHGYWAGDEPPDTPVARLAPYYLRGVKQLHLRPAVLMTALDSKCGDYRNRGLRISDVGLLIVLEMGGLPTKHVEAGLGKLRLGAFHDAVLIAVATGLE